MNKEIQPEFKEVTVTCACGTVYTTHSAKGDMKVDICSNCHIGQEMLNQLLEVVEQINLKKNMVCNNKDK